jgi:hypothetical protein
MFAVGDTVVTPHGLGEVEAIMAQRDREGRWVWGVFRCQRGPYLVRLATGALIGYVADDLSYRRPAWPLRVDSAWLDDLWRR